jgi:SET domain-containing protein 6
MTTLALQTCAGCSLCRHGYLSELPPREHLPVFWTAPERALLAGTERAAAPEQDAALMREDFEEVVLPLVAQYPERLPPAAFTLDRFMAAASWVASRAFGVDSHHGVGFFLADSLHGKPLRSCHACAD